MPAVSPRYTLAVLCYLFDADGRVLLLHRRKPPNRDLYSPVGGKLETDIGESPASCAVREIHEETGLRVTLDELHLAGLVSETSYQDAGHWLMFLYELKTPVDPAALAMAEFDEGRLEWHDPDTLPALSLPPTDRDVIWPLFWRHRGGFFAAHIDCAGDTLSWRVEQATPPAASAPHAWGPPT